MPTGVCTITQQGVDGSYTNIWTQFGVSLSDGALSSLLAWPEVKPYVENESRLEDGKRIDNNTPVKYQPRTITLEMHLIAPNLATFLTREKAFFDFISSPPKGIILELYGVYGLTYEQKLVFRLKYLSCTQFGVYNGALGKFAVRFIEPSPLVGGVLLNSVNPNDNENENDNEEEGEEE